MVPPRTVLVRVVELHLHCLSVVVRDPVAVVRHNLNRSRHIQRNLRIPIGDDGFDLREGQSSRAGRAWAWWRAILEGATWLGAGWVGEGRNCGHRSRDP